MKKTVIVAQNILEAETWETFEVEDVRDFLMQKFPRWPDGAHIYHGQVSESTDVTPVDEAGVELLGSLEGPFWVIVYPGGWTVAIATVVAILVSVASAYIFKPKPPATIRSNTNPSPNNELSERENRPRVGERIPDIFGQVRSTPDLISVPYRVFSNHEEMEYSLMCVGRGSYDVSDIRDGSSPFSDIVGSAVEVYGPNTSPVSGHNPQLRIGSPIGEPIYTAKRYAGVNGQVLRPPSDYAFNGNLNVRFVQPNRIELDPNNGTDWTTKFAPGDPLALTGAEVPTGGTTTVTRPVYFHCDYGATEGYVYISSGTVPTVGPGDYITISNARADFVVVPGEGLVSTDLSGTYQVTSVDDRYIYLNNPQAVNTSWWSMNVDPGGYDEQTHDATFSWATGGSVSLSGDYVVTGVSAKALTLSNPGSVIPAWNTIGTTSYLSPILSTSGPRWVGPFTMDLPNIEKCFCNFVAPNGLYTDDGTTQTALSVQVEIELTPIDANGNPGTPEVFQATVEGSSQVRSSRAVTLKASPVFRSPKARVRARRITLANTTFNGTVIDEVKWRDVYAMDLFTGSDFGDVTTVYALSSATDGALQPKDRKLNLLATRRVPLWNGDGTWTSPTKTTSAAPIIFAICRDPFIGRRTDAEVDFAGIQAVVDSVSTYFGHANAAAFSYTFDSDNLSFEETLAMVAQAIFCTAYRQGSQIKLAFEKATPDSVLLFNHRNKLPGSETRTVRFGNAEAVDGVELDFVDPVDDAIVTLHIPDDSAVNPKKVETLGIRNGLQAYFHGWRIWNKLRYQNVHVEFEATQEAELLVQTNRILVADNTRPDTQDGEVRAQNGLELTLSQDVTFTGGVSYTIFLQHTDGTVESKPITAGSAANKVVLGSAPKAALALADDLFSKSTYIIVGNTDAREKAFLVTEKDPKSNMTTVVRAVNYDDRYYSNDDDYTANVVNANGELI